MSRTARLWKGLGPWTLGGLLLSGLAAGAAEPTAPTPLARQLTELGRQAVTQGEPDQARSFFRKALQLDPKNEEARRALSRLGAPVRRAAFQAPAAGDAPPAAEPPAAAPPADAPPAAAEPPAATPPAAEPITGPRPAASRATIEEAERLSEIARQQLVTDVRERLREAQNLVNQGAPDAALNTLRLVQSVVRGADQVPEADRSRLDREIQAQLLATVRAEERITAERAEVLRREAQSEQQLRALELVSRNQETVGVIMVQFDSLMAQGQYNVFYSGGIGDIMATTAPFLDARLLAQKARALEPNHAAPRAGVFVAATEGFLAQEMAYEMIKEYRFMLTMQDVSRAAIPFPDTITIEYPDADLWRALSERRIKRYGRRSTSSTATLRRSRSWRNWKSRSPCRSPTRRRSKTSSSTSSRPPRGRTTRASRSTSTRSACRRPRRR